MRADYSELSYFWGANSYPYIDLNYQNQADNTTLDYNQVQKNIVNISKEGNKFIEISTALNIDVKTEIKVLSKAADYPLNVYEACLIYQQTGSKLEVVIHFYEEAISDIIFYFGLKGTVKGLVLGELLSAAPRSISKKAVYISGIFLAADYALNPYISKSLSDFIKQYDIPILNIPYIMQKQLTTAKYKKEIEDEQQKLLDAYGIPNMNGRISLEDVIYNMWW